MLDTKKSYRHFKLSENQFSEPIATMEFYSILITTNWRQLLGVSIRALETIKLPSGWACPQTLERQKLYLAASLCYQAVPSQLRVKEAQLTVGFEHTPLSIAWQRSATRATADWKQHLEDIRVKGQMSKFNLQLSRMAKPEAHLRLDPTGNLGGVLSTPK